MPRIARVISKTKVYHVIIRGHEGKSVFTEDQDKVKLLDILSQKKEKGSFLLYAYCIMNSHAHLLVKEDRESVADALQRVTMAYAYYYNKKYRRSGPVFQ